MLGTTIGHIRIVDLLGQGGMGEVYLGVDERLQRRVALKAIRNEHRLSAGSRERLLLEARSLSALDHPNICRIYDYLEEPSCDFLVLELIEGMTLTRALQQGMSRARKARIARQIVLALVAAHRRGIVHRDLKPDNIMIARDGTVKVLDFGLARPQNAEEPLPPEASNDAESADTLLFPSSQLGAGTGVAGTPLFMSPEQARGAVLTTASDLYSFGLVLQMMLTEQPPRAMGDTRREWMRSAAAGETLPMKDQPRAWTALVARLTSFAPADRPTAVETLAAIDRILAAPGRRARIAIAALLIAIFLGGAVKYALDITAARRAAERRRIQAEKLVAFVVGDLPQRLAPVGRLDVLDGAATEALEYFAALQAEELTGDELQRAALALTQLGDVRIQQGKLPEAVAMFRQSLRFAQAAAAQDPARDDWQLALSNSHFYVGDALRRQGHAHAALAQFRAYYDISARLAAKHPGDAKYETELSYGHSNLGSAYESLGDLSRAAAEYRTAVDVDRRRSAREPANEQHRGDLATSLNKLGVVQQLLGDHTGARTAFEEDVAIRRQLAAAKPDDTRRASRLAISLAYLGSAQLNTGDSDKAVATDREELAITTRLAARDEENLDWQRGRAVAQLRLADALSVRGPTDDGEVASLLDASLATLERLTAKDSRPTWQRDLAAVHQQQARLATRRGNRERAATHGARAVALAEKALATQTTDVHAARVLCEASTDLAESELRDRREAAARERAARVVTLARTVPYDRDPRIGEAAARALVILERPAEAEALVARLSAANYRRPTFTARWDRSTNKPEAQP
ncbi:MAG TPA: serine/threonine-protein kinase [Thermoanaerobaculia bacterium]